MGEISQERFIAALNIVCDYVQWAETAYQVKFDANACVTIYQLVISHVLEKYNIINKENVLKSCVYLSQLTPSPNYHIKYFFEYCTCLDEASKKSLNGRQDSDACVGVDVPNALQYRTGASHLQFEYPKLYSRLNSILAAVTASYASKYYMVRKVQKYLLRHHTSVTTSENVDEVLLGIFKSFYKRSSIGPYKSGEHAILLRTCTEWLLAQQNDKISPKVAQENDACVVQQVVPLSLKRSINGQAIEYITAQNTRIDEGADAELISRGYSVMVELP